jgi:hypothetical protein
MGPNATRISAGKSIVDPHVVPIRPSECIKPLPERRDPGPRVRIALVEAEEHADATRLAG